MKPEAGIFIAMTLALAACAGLPSANKPAPVVEEAPAIRDTASTGGEAPGFLAASALPDATLILPPAPPGMVVSSKPLIGSQLFCCVGSNGN